MVGEADIYEAGMPHPEINNRVCNQLNRLDAFPHTQQTALKHLTYTQCAIALFIALLHVITTLSQNRNEHIIITSLSPSRNYHHHPRLQLIVYNNSIRECKQNRPC